MQPHDLEEQQKQIQGIEDKTYVPDRKQSPCRGIDAVGYPHFTKSILYT
jgi:hypothetical protein